MRSKRFYLALALALFLVEVLIATKLKNLGFVRGSLGDFLVVGLVYFAVQGVRKFRPVPLGLGVFVFACMVEFSQGLHLAERLGLRPGSVLQIVLGSVFSWSDIAMYLLGCIAAVALDRFVLGNRHGS
jgi:Protein of unknown function (DUF2809)